MNVKDVQPGNGYRIPAEAYFDEDDFQREQECLFPAVWNFIGMGRRESLSISKGEPFEPFIILLSNIGLSLSGVARSK
jgi:hypothetical protein